MDYMASFAHDHYQSSHLLVGLYLEPDGHEKAVAKSAEFDRDPNTLHTMDHHCSE